MNLGIGFFADAAAILTAIIAAWGYGCYRHEQCKKRKKLEEYLKAEKLIDGDKGQRSILHIVANVGLTESEILQASFSSPHIQRRSVVDEKTKRVTEILFEYKA